MGGGGGPEGGGGGDWGGEGRAAGGYANGVWIFCSWRPVLDLVSREVVESVRRVISVTVRRILEGDGGDLISGSIRSLNKLGSLSMMIANPRRVAS